MHAVGTLSSFMRFFVVLQAFSNWRRIQSSLFSTGSCRQIFLTIFGIGLFMCFQGFATCCIFLLILLVFLALNFRHKNSSVLFFVLHRLFIHSRLLILFLEFRTHLNFLHENSLELSSRLHRILHKVGILFIHMGIQLQLRVDTRKSQRKSVARWA